MSWGRKTKRAAYAAQPKYATITMARIRKRSYLLRLLETVFSFSQTEHLRTSADIVDHPDLARLAEQISDEHRPIAFHESIARFLRVLRF